jgi:hypothetical protein
LTTPVAFPQKAFNVRRDHRVALLYSDPTGSGLTDPPTVLIQGRAIAPHAFAPLDELADYWREVFGKFPWAAKKLESEQFQRTMDWFYWRIPIYVTPEQVHVLPQCEVGGAIEPPSPAPNTPLTAQVRDALWRYPTSVFTARDDHGWPYVSRATITAATDSNSYLVKPVESVPVKSGPASLLWHRHGGRANQLMSSLLVVGTTSTGPERLAFTPERIPAAAPSTETPLSPDDWREQARKTSLNYLQQHNIDPPKINWPSLVNYATS